MLKNKFKIIALLLVIILAITIPVARAAEEENVTTETPAEDNYKNADAYYITGDDVTIDYIVDGNLFVIANSVTINSQIGGDAFIFANSVTIGEEGYIFSNLFTITSNLEINGIVYDVYSISQNATITGYVYRDIRMSSSNLNLWGTIGRNAYLDTNSLSLVKNVDTENAEEMAQSAQGVISGNLNYSASSEAQIPEGAVIGNVNYTPEEKVSTGSAIQSYIMNLGTFLATVIIIWLLCLWLAPKFLQNMNILASKKILPIIGFGILTPLAVIILATVFIILGITSKIALLAIAMLIILLLISSSIFVIAINDLICSKLKIEKKLATFGMLIVSSIVFWLVCLIPYLGTLVGFIAWVLGLGLIMNHIVLARKSLETAKK